ncbi:enoyl-CoA hydratase [Roseibium polysiphoniae]|uniref:Enoyl-CoA hydratase n=1 Tax=Roseibium polysiphoniae TaxID=2571221 RepID=A0A944CJ34_9HYPH|nr:enoyl-CoA hydratase [Roseibium polysiphoniae]
MACLLFKPSVLSPKIGVFGLIPKSNLRGHVQAGLFCLKNPPWRVRQILENTIVNTPLASDQGTISTRVDGSIGWLVVDNTAKRNALSLAMWKQVSAAVDRLVADPNVRVIVVRGAGETSFVSGADISEFEQTRSTAAAAKAYDVINVAAFRALKHAAKPTIAMIRGHCLGGGLGLALACDLRIAAAGSVFGIPAARLGIAYPLDAMSDIVEAVGPATAKRLLFTAERIGAEEALRIQLIGEAVAEADLDARIAALCTQLANNAPLTQAAAKLAINAIAAGCQDDAMALAAKAAETCFESRDFAEGRDAFLEKRQPNFSGT